MGISLVLYFFRQFSSSDLPPTCRGLQEGGAFLFSYKGRLSPLAEVASQQLAPYSYGAVLPISSCLPFPSGFARRIESLLFALRVDPAVFLFCIAPDQG